MKNVKYLFLLILGVSSFSLSNVQAETIKTTKNGNANITWDDIDKSNSINTGDEFSVVYKSGASTFNATQQFTVIKNEGEYTYLLAMYNLNIGSYKVNPDVKEGITQSSIRAWISNDVTNYGTVTLDEVNSNLDNWLDNYKIELKNNYNFSIEDISLLSRKDAINYLSLTTNSGGEAFKYNSDKYSNTSYWLSDMDDSSGKYFINGADNTIDIQSSGYSGIRPVIKVKTKYLNEVNLNYVKPQNITSSNDEVCLKIDDTTQCFIFLKKGKNNTNYYFSKYNLNVGSYYNQNKKIGLQDSSIRAWVDSSSPNYGRVPYDTAKVYFQDYKDRIFNNGYNIISIDYLTKNDAFNYYSLTAFEAENINSITTAYNNNAFASLYANTTYWLKDEYTSNYYYYINAENKISVANDVSGVRPVIQLAALDITDSEKFNHGKIDYKEADDTIIISPDTGYELDNLYILNANGEYLDYKKITTNTYKFTNNYNWNINVSATFKAIEYKFINSNNQTYQEDNLKFEVDAKKDMIDKIYINNNLLESKNYNINESYITLKKEYLSTLADDDYSLKVEFKNGTSDEIEFKVKKIYTISFSQDENTDFATTSIKVTNTDTNELEIKAKLGYEVTSIKINGIESINKLINNKLNLSNISSDTTIKISSTAITYKFTEGINTTFNDKDMKFKVNGPLSLFDKVYINDELITSDNYTLENGSTVITLSKSYLKTLKSGTYTLMVTYKNNTNAKTTFIIKDKEEVKDTNKINIENPKTYDNIYCYIVLASLSVVMLIILLIYHKKAHLK